MEKENQLPTLRGKLVDLAVDYYNSIVDDDDKGMDKKGLLLFLSCNQWTDSEPIPEQLTHDQAHEIVKRWCR